MARLAVNPGDLIGTVARVLGIPEPTVFQYDRQLVTAGIRRPHGRGRSAKSVTPTDAANLLIAIAAAPIAGSAIQESVDSYETYASLPAVDSSGERFAAWPPTLSSKCLRELGYGHSLKEGI